MSRFAESDHSEQEATTDAPRAAPLLLEEMAQAQYLNLAELKRESPIDAALIEMHLPPEIKRVTVRFARQSVAEWCNFAGKMRRVQPAVVLWGLLAEDASGSRYQGSLIGVEGGAQIEAVMQGSNVLGLVNQAAGGEGIATDSTGFTLWSRASAALEDDVWLKKKLDLSDTELPGEIAAWTRERQAESPEFDIDTLHLGVRALPHVTTTGLYRVGAKDGAFQMAQVGPLLRSVSTSYAAHRLGSPKYPWRGQRGEGTRLTSVDARRRLIARALENPVSDPRYKVPGLDGDIDKVISEAETDFRRRRTENVWRELLPPSDDPTAIERARNFVEFVNSELLDLRIPDSCAESESDPAARQDIPYTARIRDLPFWDCYELVEITERMGGRRRH